MADELTSDEKSGLDAPPDFSRTDMLPAATGFEDEPTRVGAAAVAVVPVAPHAASGASGEDEEEIEAVDDAELIEEIADEETTHGSSGDLFPHVKQKKH